MLTLHDEADDALSRCRSMAAAVYEAVSHHPALQDQSVPSLILWELARTMEERAIEAMAARDAEFDASKA